MPKCCSRTGGFPTFRPVALALPKPGRWQAAPFETWPFFTSTSPFTVSANPKLIETLNELALFVNDRTEGYKTGATKTKDAQNQACHQQLVQQSQ